MRKKKDAGFALLEGSKRRDAAAVCVIPSGVCGAEGPRVWCGIINYALVIALAISPPPALAGAIVRGLAPLIALFYVAAISERAWLFYRSR